MNKAKALFEQTKDQIKSTNSQSVVAQVFIAGSVKPIAKTKLEAVHVSPLVEPGAILNIADSNIHTIMAYEAKNMIYYPHSANSDAGRDDVSQTKKYSTYIDYLKKLDDDEMDHMSWSLKRFSKKK